MRIVIPNNGGGNQVIRSAHNEVHAMYAGVYVELKGYYDFTGPNCAVTLTMEPHEAVKLALNLLRGANQHGKATQTAVKRAVRQYAKTLEIKL